jgi:uncharacterized alkaline shock family protein YloU
METTQPGAAMLARRAREPGEDGAAGGEDAIGTVRIARRVLRTVVREAALGVPGVARPAASSVTWAAVLGRPRPRDGVALTVHGNAVAVDLYLVVEPGVNMVTVGEAVQDTVAAAIEHMLDMRATLINIYIRDVA